MSNVIDIEDLRIQRQRQHASRPIDECKHKRLILDDEGCIVRCSDCHLQLAAYWTLTFFLEHYELALAKINARERRHAESESRGVHLRAAQIVERAWRSHTMVPTCPHCGEGIRTSDGFGHSAINKSIDERRRAAKRP
jgi:ribosomal protein S27E